MSDMQKITATLNNKMDTIRKQRAEQRVKEGKPIDLDETGKAIEEANVLNLAIRDFGKLQGNVGQVMLAGMFMQYQNQTFRTDECDTLEEWAETQMGDEVDLWYMKSLAKVVETIFAYVHKREKAENPVLDADTNTPITVDMLISTPGLVSKLKENADWFSKQESDEKRDELISDIATKPRSKINATKAKQQKSEIDPQMIIKAVFTVKENGKNTITMEDISDAQVELVRKSLGKAIDMRTV